MYHVAAGGLNRKIRPIACQDRQNENPDYIANLSLLKEDGKWLIIHKLYTALSEE